jgi:hypothetical protein
MSEQPSDARPRDLDPPRFDPGDVGSSLAGYHIDQIVRAETRLARAWPLIVALLWACFALVDAITYDPGCRSPSRQVRIDLHNLATSLEVYGLQTHESCPPSLEALVEAGLLRRISLDPWGQPYHYRCTVAGRPEVRSAGPDRRLGTDDDLRLDDL